jgi:hypothetical protein
MRMSMASLVTPTFNLIWFLRFPQRTSLRGEAEIHKSHCHIQNILKQGIYLVGLLMIHLNRPGMEAISTELEEKNISVEKQKFFGTEEKYWINQYRLGEVAESLSKWFKENKLTQANRLHIVVDFHTGNDDADGYDISVDEKQEKQLADFCKEKSKKIDTTEILKGAKILSTYLQEYIQHCEKKEDSWGCFLINWI